MSYSLDHGRLIVEESDPEHPIAHVMCSDGTCLVLELGICVDPDEPVWIAYEIGRYEPDGTLVEYADWRCISDGTLSPPEPLWLWLHDGEAHEQLVEHARWLAMHKREAV